MLDRLAPLELPLTIVVEGAHRLPREPGSPEANQVRVVHCDDWDVGPGASLRCGLSALPDEVTHAVVILADGPTLDPRAVERLVSHRGDAEVVAASYDGSRSHPVVLARSAWGHVPDAGGRALDAVLVDCSDLDPPGDVDVPAQDPPTAAS